MKQLLESRAGCSLARDRQMAILTAAAIDIQDTAAGRGGVQAVDQGTGHSHESFRRRRTWCGFDDGDASVAPLSYLGVERDLSEQGGLGELGDLLTSARAEQLVPLDRKSVV